MAYKRKKKEREGGGLASFSNALNDLKLPKSVKSHLKNAHIWGRWAEIVGVELTKHTSPASISGKTLQIHVSHQAWAQQLQFLQPSILGKIKALCPESEISELYFKVGKIRKSEPPQNPANAKISKKMEGPVKLTDRMEMILRSVQDDNLRSSIRKAMEAETIAKDQIEPSS